MNKIVFEHSKVNAEKLLACGFQQRSGGYFKALPLMDGQFVLNLFVQNDGIVETEMLDTASEEEYVLHLVEDCGGSFVGEVRLVYRAALDELKNTCFETDVFNGKLTKVLIDHIEKTYGVFPEYLWEKYPKDAVFRRSDNRKWFAIILSVKRDKLSLSGENEEEIVDFRAISEEIPALLEQKRYLGGYHMNKKHWVTALLDGSVPLEELAERIDESYRLAK